MYATSIDVRRLLSRMTEIERNGIGPAALRALNDAAFGVRAEWQKEVQQVFDRPSPLTIRAPLVKKATPLNPSAEVFIRNEARGGTPPSEYLQPQAEGGQRRQKPFEYLLDRLNPFAAKFYVPGRGAALDRFGNLAAKTIKKIQSQLGAAQQFSGYLANETGVSRARRLRRQRKKGGGGSFFMLPSRRGKLKPGVVYERIETAFGSSVRSILFPVNTAPKYTRRFNAEEVTRRIFNRLFQQRFYVELTKRIRSAEQ